MGSTCDLQNAVELVHRGAAGKDGFPGQQLAQYAACAQIHDN